MRHILLSATGRLATADLTLPYPEARAGQVNQPRAPHDVILSAAESIGQVGAVTSAGRALLIDAAGLPELPDGPWSLADAPAAADLLGLPEDEDVVAVYSLDPDVPPLALGTVQGVVKRVVPEYKGWDEWEVIGLKEGDRVIGAAPAADADDVVFITSDGQLLRTPAREVRAQGRPAGGMAGVRLAEGARVLAFAAVARADRDAALVATLATGPRPDAPWTAKVTPFALYPAKGRATGGVRCHRFLKDQDRLALAWAGLPPARASDHDGGFRNLPAVDERRDGTGTKVYASFAYLG
jgi:DNA gyrase subunit A